MTEFNVTIFHEWQIVADETVPRDVVVLVPPRQHRETLSEWARRCAVITNIAARPSRDQED